jgi:hypothetical protein
MLERTYIDSTVGCMTTSTLDGSFIGFRSTIAEKGLFGI